MACDVSPVAMFLYSYNCRRYDELVSALGPLSAKTPTGLFQKQVPMFGFSHASTQSSQEHIIHHINHPDIIIKTKQVPILYLANACARSSSDNFVKVSVPLFLTDGESIIWWS